MAIKDKDMKLLWATSFGRCNNPNCNTSLIDTTEKHTYGEMAHIIAKNADGPRGNPSITNNNTYDNLLLLCPNCHTKIDKSPEKYPLHLLKIWKNLAEEKYSSFFESPHFSTMEELKSYLRNYLIENKTCFNQLGPQSKVAINKPNSNLSTLWKLRKLELIIPNNKKIISALEKNISLLSSDQLEFFYLFKEHAIAFEKHQYNPLEDYPLFPKNFEDIFL